ncbi:MAG TPA: two-component regulator propeller domain-containing protein [Pseudoxanthomonas sp.]
MVPLTGKLWREDASGELRLFDIPSGIFPNAIWRDRAGVLWVGGPDKGLWSIQTAKAMLMELPADIAEYGRAGRSVIGDGAGGVWLGYNCGGLRHRLKDGSFGSPPTPAAGAPECVISLLRDAEGRVWAGSGDNGLQRIVDGALEELPQSSGLLNLQIWQADDGEYWLGAENHTFNLRRTDTGAFVLSPPVAALEGQTIRKMAMARKGGIWFVGDQGAMRLDKGRVVERWTPAQGLSSRFARSLYEDSRGVLWIGTYGSGLNRIENGRITHYDESNGLFDDTVSCILADRTGQMWLAGNRGISVLPLASQLGLKFETVPFAASNGSVSFEFNGGTQSACYQDEEGYLWFALVTGFAKVDPARLAEISALQPEAHIERVVTAGVKHYPGETLVLNTSVQPLEIGYTAINLTNPDQLSFRYRISGGDAKWTQAGASRDIVIYDVPWGNHVFEVQARNRGGSWSPSARLKISRPVPWYRHQWLWPLIALLALLALIWRTRDPALSAAHDERLRRMSSRKLLDHKEPSDRR